MSAKKLLMAILFVISVFLAGCSSVATTVVDPIENMQHGSWNVLRDGCEKTDDKEIYQCTRKCLEEAYDEMVNCHYNLKECQLRLDQCEIECTLLLQKCQIDLDAWHRQWYITGAIGFGAGGLVALVLALALGA